MFDETTVGRLFSATARPLGRPRGPPARRRCFSLPQTVSDGHRMAPTRSGSDSRRAPPNHRPSRSRDRGAERPSGIVSCRVRVTLPPGMWMGELTRAHPSAVLEVRDRLPLGRAGAMFEIVLTSHEPVDWPRELRGQRQLRRVEWLATTGRSATYRVVSVGRTFIPLIRRLRLLRSFPFPVRDGIATWTVVGPEARVRRLWAGLRETGVRFSLDAVRPGLPREPLGSLTPRQRQILRRALADGYFEVPRRVSLTVLASRIGVATSTLSVALALIEKRIVESHVALVPP